MTGEPLIRRSDDNEDTLKKRLLSYHKSTTPLVNYYQKRGLHTVVDASKPPKVVDKSITEKFREKVGKDKVAFI